MLRHLRKLPRHHGATSIASTQKVRVRRDRNAPWRQLVLIAMFLGLSVHLALGVSAESEGSSPVSAAAAQQVEPPPVQKSRVRRYGPETSTSFRESPALIGGMRIRVGSDVYDGSVKAGLAALEKSF